MYTVLKQILYKLKYHFPPVQRIVTISTKRCSENWYMYLRGIGVHGQYSLYSHHSSNPTFESLYDDMYMSNRTCYYD